MHSSRNKQKYEKSALRISITGSTIFVILEIVMAVITRSQAVLLDSVYDGVEILMVFVSLSLVPLMYKPSSESHPHQTTIIIRRFQQTQRIPRINKRFHILSIRPRVNHPVFFL